MSGYEELVCNLGRLLEAGTLKKIPSKLSWLARLLVLPFKPYLQTPSIFSPHTLLTIFTLFPLLTHIYIRASLVIFDLLIV